jgi:hypothetical protein
MSELTATGLTSKVQEDYLSLQSLKSGNNNLTIAGQTTTVVQATLDSYRNIDQTYEDVPEDYTDTFKDIIQGLDRDSNSSGVQTSLTQFSDTAKRLFSNQVSPDWSTIETMMQEIYAIEDEKVQRLLFSTLLRVLSEVSPDQSNEQAFKSLRMAIIDKIVARVNSEYIPTGFDGNPLINGLQRDVMRSGDTFSASGLMNITSNIASLFTPGGVLQLLGLMRKFSRIASVTNHLTRNVIRYAQGIPILANLLQGNVDEIKRDNLTPAFGGESVRDAFIKYNGSWLGAAPDIISGLAVIGGGITAGAALAAPIALLLGVVGAVPAAIIGGIAGGFLAVGSMINSLMSRGIGVDVEKLTSTQEGANSFMNRFAANLIKDIDLDAAMLLNPSGGALVNRDDGTLTASDEVEVDEPEDEEPSGEADNSDNEDNQVPSNDSTSIFSRHTGS